MSKITVQHECLKKNGRIRFRKFRRDGYDQFKIRLTLSGPLEDIDYVEYELHPTFSPPTRTSHDRAGHFPSEFWTWGEFEVGVTAYLVDGTLEETTYDLQYSDELPTDDAAYYDETPTNLRGAS
jgi:hypothetical protein